MIAVKECMGEGRKSKKGKKETKLRTLQLQANREEVVIRWYAVNIWADADADALSMAPLRAYSVLTLGTMYVVV